MPEEILKFCMVLFSKMASATPELTEFCLMTKQIMFRYGGAKLTVHHLLSGTQVRGLKV